MINRKNQAVLDLRFILMKKHINNCFKMNIYLNSQLFATKVLDLLMHFLLVLMISNNTDDFELTQGTWK